MTTRNIRIERLPEKAPKNSIFDIEWEDNSLLEIWVDYKGSIRTFWSLRSNTWDDGHQSRDFPANTPLNEIVKQATKLLGCSVYALYEYK
jgi:hypothetical protein